MTDKIPTYQTTLLKRKANKMTYQLQATDRLGSHCYDNPHIMDMVKLLFDFYDHILSEYGEVDYLGFSQDARELIPDADMTDLSYAIFQIGVNRDFKI